MESEGDDRTSVRAAPAHEASTGVAALPVEAPGRYQVPEGLADIELGRGGMGRVLHLKDVHLGRAVAVKELLDNPDLPPQHHAFLHEARVLARLEHPGVVPVYEVARRPDGTPYYAMRKVEGGTLAQALGAAATLEQRLALLPHLLEVAHTVAYAHAHGVVHRDLKPQNVMVGPFGETLVLDWGLAVLDGDDAGMSGGTPAYMAPEQAQGRPVDARADVWSLGVMLYEVLTGALPFSGSTQEVLARSTRGALRPVAEVAPEAPAALVALVTQALQPNPARRPASGVEFAAALQEAVWARRPPSRRWLWVALSCAVALALSLAWGATTSAQLSRLELQRSRADDATARHLGRTLAQQSKLALARGDALGATALAQEALSHGHQPLARGVLLLAGERGVPRRAWQHGAEAGCATVAVVKGVVACATLNGTLLLDLATGASVGTLSPGPTGWTHALAELPGGALAAVGDDRVVRVWDVGAGRLLRASPALSASVLALAARGAGLVAGLRSGQVVALDEALVPRPVATLDSAVRRLAAGPGVLALSGAYGGRVDFDGGLPFAVDRPVGALASWGEGVLLGVERAVVAVRGPGQWAAWRGHEDDVTALAAGSPVVSGDASGELRWWEEAGPGDVVVAGVVQVGGPVRALAAVPGSRAVVVATGRKSVERWDLPDASSRLLAEGFPASHVLSASGWLLSGLKDGRVRRVALSTREATFFEAGHQGAVRAVAEVPGEARGRALRHLSGGEDGAVKGLTWGGEPVVLELGALPVVALAVTPDGRRAAWAFSDGTLVLWDLSLAKEVQRQRLPLAHRLAFSPDGRTLAVARDDGRLGVLDADEGRERVVHELGGSALLALAFHPDGARVVVGHADGQVTLWHLAERRAEHRWPVSSQAIRTVAVSADGARLAAGGDEGALTLLDVEARVVQAEVPLQASDLQVAAFVGDGAVVAVGADRALHRLELDGPPP